MSTRASVLLDSAREFSTAAVMFHGLVAQRIGLSVTDLKALDLLQRLGPLPAGAIAAHTGLATASVTSLIDRLGKRRLVRRSRDRGDRRRVLVSLTPHVQRTIAPLFASLNRRMLARLKRYDRDQAALIEQFLLGAAREMREEATKLTR